MMIFEAIKYTFMNAIYRKTYYKWILGEDVYIEYPNKELYFKNKWMIVSNGIISIKKGYAWDGCSPKFIMLGLFRVGTPDGAIDTITGKAACYTASLGHDALYQFGAGRRKDADRIFLGEMLKVKFPLAYAYYYAVRVFGWMFWNKG